MKAHKVPGPGHSSLCPRASVEWGETLRGRGEWSALDPCVGRPAGVAPQTTLQEGKVSCGVCPVARPLSSHTV